MSETPLLDDIVADAPLPAEVVAPGTAPTLYSADGLGALLTLAELPLGADPQAEMITALADLEPAVHVIRSVDLGETPPATAFNPRWD